MSEWIEGEDELIPQDWPTYHTEVPVWVLLSGVRSQAYKAYAFLAEHINNRTPGKRIACPKQAAIARVLGLRRPQQVTPYLNELAEIGAISIEEYRYQGGMRRGYRYQVRFNPPPGYAGHLTLKQFYEANEDVRSAKAPGRTAASGAHGGTKNVTSGGRKNVTSHSAKDVTSQGAKNVSPELDQENSDQENEAPFGRDSAPDARRAPTGSGVRASRGGYAAPGKTSAPRDKHTAEAVRAVVAALPDELRKLEGRPLPVQVPARPLGDLIRQQLKQRTAEQLADRIARRWVAHGWAEKCHSVMDGEPLRSGVGIAVRLLQAGECSHPRCEDGTDIDTGAGCRLCPERRADRRVGHGDTRSGTGLPGQRLSATGGDIDRWFCAGRDGECRAVGLGPAPADGLCRDCRQELEEVQAALVAAGFSLEEQENAVAAV